MKLSNLQAAIVAAVFTSTAHANNVDRFSYRTTDGNEFGPDDWKKVSCDDPTRCDGFPDSWDTAIGWDLENTNADCEVCTSNDEKNNNCKWCPAGTDCGQHRQSPIDLLRDRGLWNDPNEKECPDWHWMKFQDGACTWDDLVDNDDSIHRNNFLIRRHGLQILQPVDNNGNLECFKESLGGARYPRLDYSKGFPNWWHLAHTEISVPSEHTQEGKRYDAEVTLAHFYENDEIAKNQLGKVVVFLEAFETIEPWPMLDKLICQWRETEEQTRADCGYDSVTTYYPGCTNYDRGHTPAPIDPPTDAPTFPPITAEISTSQPTTAQPTTAQPTPAAPFITQAPVPVVPTTPTPTGSIGIGFQYNPCNICGDADLKITTETAMVDFPAFGDMTCREFENAGIIGLLNPSFCKIFPAFVTQCDCAPNGNAGVPAPLSPSPPTGAPVIAKVTSAPESGAPVTPTAAPVTSAPVTQAPSGSSSPSTEPSSAPSRLPTVKPTLAPSKSPTVSTEPSSAPSSLPTVKPTLAPSSLPTVKPTLAPSSFPTVKPTLAPSKSPTVTPEAPPTNPPTFNCPTFEENGSDIDVNYNRICKEDSCCESEKRSATDFCHDVYSFFDEVMPSVCFSCCDEPKILAPAPAPHRSYDPIDCSLVENPFRICNPTQPDSCCGERSGTTYCQGIYKLYPGDLIHSVCHYCCEEPLEVDDQGGRLLPPPRGGRLLRSESDIEARKAELAVPTEFSEERELKLLRAISQPEEVEDERTTALRHSNADARIHHIKLEPENKIVDDIDDDEYFKELMVRHLKNENVERDQEERERRRLVNYEDVEYWPYEWLMKVKTEYYFRYEGTQAVPPCKDQVHWRVMKDPIPVAQRQIDELQRLMGERIAPAGSRHNECDPDHAGKLREGTTNKFDFARPVQSFHKLHRKVFCECKDWKSKFPEDRGWCDRNIFDRFYNHPYNFDAADF